MRWTLRRLSRWTCRSSVSSRAQTTTLLELRAMTRSVGSDRDLLSRASSLMAEAMIALFRTLGYGLQNSNCLLIERWCWNLKHLTRVHLAEELTRSRLQWMHVQTLKGWFMWLMRRPVGTKSDWNQFFLRTCCCVCNLLSRDRSLPH